MILSAQNRSKRIRPLLKGVVVRRRSSSTGVPRPGSVRRGLGYPVTPKWQADVKAHIATIGWTEKDFAKKVKCAQSTMHDLLNDPEAKHSSLIPAIHRVLGWAEPSTPEAIPVIFSPDALEIAGMYDRLPEDVRRSMRDQAAAILALLNKTKPIVE